MMKMRKNGAEIPDQGFHPCEDKLAAVLKVDAGQLMELEEGKLFEKQKKLVVFQYAKQLLLRYKKEDLSSVSAQVAFYLLLAFFPFLIFSINLLSYTSLANEFFITNFYTFLPNDTDRIVKDMLVQAVQAKSTTLLFSGIIASLWAASQGTVAIVSGLNKSYDVEEDRNFIELTVMALLSTIGVSIVIVFTFIMIIFGKIAGFYIFEIIGAGDLFHFLWPILQYVVPVSLMLTTFFLMYKYLPNKNFAFKHIMVGATFTTVGWIAISLLFSFYVDNFAKYEKVYGSLGGVFALLIWLYISALIILLGGALIDIGSEFENKEKIQ